MIMFILVYLLVRINRYIVECKFVNGFLADIPGRELIDT